MLELKEALQQRLAVLNGLPTKSENKVITNTSREYIAHTLTQAGILNGLCYKSVEVLFKYLDQIHIY
jgi:hypothetical protein